MILPLLSIALLLQSSPAPKDARELFLTNCARCHGETGDGQGVTTLDRPARSFKDGGFSFGNTPEAIFRTLTVGIPGTPMPGFESSLSVDERRRLADYVITLGPEVREVSNEDTLLTVRDRARFVRGLLPPIAEGGTEQPRGLLLGTPTGMTFEYRADDVRLLGLRQGGFVRRRDWTGRGGTALEPLGQVVHLIEAGTPREPFTWGSARDPLRARLRATRVRGSQGTLEYTLHGADNATVASVRETPRARGSSVGAGFIRTFEIDPEETGTLWLRVAEPGEDEVVATFEERGVHWLVLRRGPRAIECNLIDRRAPQRPLTWDERHSRIALPLESGKPERLSALRLMSTEWNADVHAAVREVVAR